MNLEPIEAVVFKRPVGGEYQNLFRPYWWIPGSRGVYYQASGRKCYKSLPMVFKNVSFSILLISVLLGVSIALKSGNLSRRARVKEMFSTGS